MIEVDGVFVRCVLVTELADRLIHEGELETASRLLYCLAREPRIELTDEHREVLCRVLPEPLAGLEELWNVICPEDDPDAVLAGVT